LQQCVILAAGGAALAALRAPRASMTARFVALAAVLLCSVAAVCGIITVPIPQHLSA